MKSRDALTSFCRIDQLDQNSGRIANKRGECGRLVPGQGICIGQHGLRGIALDRCDIYPAPDQSFQKSLQVRNSEGNMLGSCCLQIGIGFAAASRHGQTVLDLPQFQAQVASLYKCSLGRDRFDPEAKLDRKPENLPVPRYSGLKVGDGNADMVNGDFRQHRCAQVEVLDKIIANWVALPKSVLFREDLLTRAHNSGKHLVECLKRELTLADYIGEPGLCPICHSKLVEIREGDSNYPAICGICGVRGTLTVTDGKVKFDVSQEDRPHSHVLLSGKFMHGQELQERSLVPHPNAHEIPERFKKYENYLKPSKPVRAAVKAD